MTGAPGPPPLQAGEPSHAPTPRVRLTLLGVGAMNSPRFAPAGLLVRCGDAVVAIDGGPGAEPPVAVDAWLVTDEHAELRAALRRLARARDMPAPALAEHVTGILAVRPFPVEHTSHPAYGYRISAGGQIAVWAPESWRYPCWADRAPRRAGARDQGLARACQRPRPDQRTAPAARPSLLFGAEECRPRAPPGRPRIGWPS